jgi:DNA-directed RNA polymerase subunit N (RpoN/RPB10)
LFLKIVKDAQAQKDTETKEDDLPYFVKDKFEKTIHGNALDELGIHSMCCRMAVLTHVG